MRDAVCVIKHAVQAERTECNDERGCNQQDVSERVCVLLCFHDDTPFVQLLYCVNEMKR